MVRGATPTRDPSIRPMPPEMKLLYLETRAEEHPLELQPRAIFFLADPLTTKHDRRGGPGQGLKATKDHCAIQSRPTPPGSNPANLPQTSSWRETAGGSEEEQEPAALQRGGGAVRKWGEIKVRDSKQAREDIGVTECHQTAKLEKDREQVGVRQCLRHPSSWRNHSNATIPQPVWGYCFPIPWPFSGLSHESRW